MFCGRIIKFVTGPTHLPLRNQQSLINARRATQYIILIYTLNRGQGGHGVCNRPRKLYGGGPSRRSGSARLKSYKQMKLLFNLNRARTGLCDARVRSLRSVRCQEAHFIMQPRPVSGKHLANDFIRPKSTL